MDRREALSIVSLICGSTIVGAGSFLSGCQPKERKSIFGLLNTEEIKILEDVAETILPKTKNAPGAKEVEIGKFINSIVSECYSKAEQESFINGLVELNDVSEEKYGDEFQELSNEQREALLLHLEEESRIYNQNRQQPHPVHFYTMIKQLTIWGYMSSEQVGTKVLRHVPIPGRFEGCIPYQQGEKSYI